MKLPKKELVKQVRQSQDDLNQYLQVLPKAALETTINQNGWVLRDVLVHLAKWQQGMVLLLQGTNRAEGMGIPQELVDAWDVDSINQHIYQQGKRMSYDEAKQLLRESNQQMLEVLENLDQEELELPYSYYDPSTPFHSPVINWISGNTHEHFNKHLEVLRNTL